MISSSFSWINKCGDNTILRGLTIALQLLIEALKDEVAGYNKTHSLLVRWFTTVKLPASLDILKRKQIKQFSSCAFTHILKPRHYFAEVDKLFNMIDVCFHQTVFECLVV